MKKRKEKVRVELRSNKGRFTEIWKGTCLKTAQSIRNGLRKQQSDSRPVIIVEH